MRVLVVNGPNLDRLGIREPEVYGTATLADLERQVEIWGRDLGVEVETVQSNHEGKLIETVHSASRFDGMVINPGALTHTSRSLGDALAAVEVPSVEVHISDVKGREPWRAVSFVSEACVYTIYGRGVEGYRDALRHLVNRSAHPLRPLRYGPHPSHVADLRLPEPSPLGLVVLAHGGFWLDPWTRDTMESLAVAFTDDGFATLNVEYRRLRDGGWPAPGHDLAMALDWTAHAPQLGPLEVALVGHSAGGHSALWVAGRDRGRPVRLTVGLAPVTDLELLASSEGPGAWPARALLAAGAPPRLTAPRPALLIHGEDDRHLPPAHSRLLETGAEVTLIPGLGHFELLDPTQEHWDPLLAAVRTALV